MTAHLGFDPNRARQFIRQVRDQATSPKPTLDGIVDPAKVLEHYVTTLAPYACVRADSLAPSEERKACERAISNARVLRSAGLPTTVDDLAAHGIRLADAVEVLLHHAERFEDVHPTEVSVTGAPPVGPESG